MSYAQIKGVLDGDCTDSTYVETAIAEVVQKKFKRYYKKYRAEFDIGGEDSRFETYFFSVQFFNDEDTLLGKKFPACPDIFGLVDKSNCTYSVGMECGTGYGRAKADYLISQGIDPYK